MEYRYIIGIDLGTTNSAVSYIDLSEDNVSRKNIRIFNIDQLIDAGEIAANSVLPSFLYIPGRYDISKDSIKLPWDTEDDNFVGVFARDHGSKVPSRLVSSAKSWLCHNNVDRKAKILPWGAESDILKVSPVQAASSYLKHIKRAWNSTKGDEDELYLENQMIVITVPASFDEVARDLTIEAAQEAGLINVTLLEEPLSAFYCWFINHENDWSQHVKPNDLILVCDVGGGTTDFTLITLKESQGTPRFERIAVGDHLILGGDNIDLALANFAESNIGKKKISLSGNRWKTLCHQCRQAKESILDKGDDVYRLTIIGEGQSLISDTLSVKIKNQDLEKIVLEGFFPLVDDININSSCVKKGITEFGLPYEHEPAITRHLGWFLNRHKEDVVRILGKEPIPDLILFNGGSLKPDIIQHRIIKAICHWFGNKNNNISVLENDSLDLSVALGASYYGLAKIGHGVKVGSGSPRSYYLGISKIEQDGNNDKKHAICVVERGLDENSKIELKDRQFEVVTNQPVSFDIYSSSFRSGDQCADIISVDDSLTLLPPIQTVIQFGKKGSITNIPVKLEGEYTEIGTLNLWCRSTVSNHKWKLQFQLRQTLSGTDVKESEIFDEKVLEAVRLEIKKVFLEKVLPGKATGLVNLSKNIVNIVGLSRAQWPLSLIRHIADELLKISDERKRSTEHEMRWLNMFGFCTRPGFGDGFDDHRVKQIWKIYKQGVFFANNSQVRNEWWIMWRRLAGGLKAGQQRQLLQDFTPIIMPKKGKVKIPPQEFIEIWMAVANMERMLIQDKIKWGRYLLAELKPKKLRPQLMWTLSRIGARDLLYGPIDRVVPPLEVASWLETIISLQWDNIKPVGMAIAQIGRRTGDRIRDINPKVVDKVVAWMDQYDSISHYTKFLTQIIPFKESDSPAIFGEDLPSGIVLKA